MPNNEIRLSLLATMPFETTEGSVKRDNAAIQLFEWWDRVRMFAAGAAGLCADEDWAASIALSMESGKLKVPALTLSGSRCYGINDAHEFLRKMQLVNESALDLLRHSPTVSLLSKVSGMLETPASKPKTKGRKATAKIPPETAPLIWFKNRYGLSDASNLKGAGAVVFSLLARAIDSVRIVHAADTRKISKKVEAALNKLVDRERPFLSPEDFNEATRHWDEKEVGQIYDKWGKDLFKRVFVNDAGSGAFSLATRLLPLLPASSTLALSSKANPGDFQAQIEKLVNSHGAIADGLRELASRHLNDERQLREYRTLYFRELARHGEPSAEGHLAARKKVAGAAESSVKSRMNALDKEVQSFLKDENLFRRIHSMIVALADPILATASLVQSDIVWKKAAIAEIEHSLERGLDRLKLLVSRPPSKPPHTRLRCNNAPLVVNLHSHWIDLELPGLPQPGFLDWMRSIAR